MVRSWLFSVSVLMVLFFIAGCGNKENVYMVRYQSVSLSSQNDAKQYIVTLNWGDKLLYQNKIMITTNSKNEEVTNLLMKRLIDGKIGYINKVYVIHKPISTAAILNTAILYDTPSSISVNKTMVTPPALCFVLLEKDKEWAEVEMYNTPSEYMIVPNSTKIYGNKWIQLKDLSTTNSDINLILSAGYSIKNFNSAKAAYSADKSQAKQEQLNKVIQAEMESLKSLINASPGSPAVGFVQHVMGIISPENQTENPSEQPSDNTEEQQL